MKELIISVLFLVSLFAACLINSNYIDESSKELISMIGEAEAYADIDKWDEAEERILDAKNIWDKKSGYLEAVLRHSETDNVYVMFETALGSIKSRDKANCKIYFSGLVASLELICETEKLTFGNIMTAISPREVYSIQP